MDFKVYISPDRRTIVRYTEQFLYYRSYFTFFFSLASFQIFKVTVKSHKYYHVEVNFVFFGPLKIKVSFESDHA